MSRRVAFPVVVVVGLLAAAVAEAQSASQLLEKGIYTEETVGNLDEAIEIYKKVIAEAKTAEAAAAQAQYRLGQCLLKQKKTDEAAAAFQKLIEDYPNQPEWVAKARQHVADKRALELGPAPWKDGEFLQLAVKLGGGLKIGSFVWSADSAKLDGKDVWRLKTYRYILPGDNRGISHVDAQKTSLRPVESTFRHTLMGRTDAVYTPSEVTVTQFKDGGQSVRKEKLDQVYYDNEEGVHVFRCLPWADGYKATVPIYVPFGGGKLGIEVEAVGREAVEVAAGKFDCYKVELRPVNQFFWFSTDASHYLVKLEAGGVVAELEQIGQSKPGEKRPYRNDALGFSLLLPAGWYVVEPSMPDGKPIDTVHLIDPEATAICTVGAWKTDSIEDAGAKKSPRAWAEYRAKKAGDALKDLRLRPDSWQERKVGELPAVSVVGDYVAGQRKKAAYGVCVFGKETLSELVIADCDPDQLERLRAEFDKIIQSYQAK